MKRNIMISIAVLLFLAPLSLGAQNRNREIDTVKFVTNIECDNCVNTIMKNIPFEKGVKDVKCDLVTKEVTIGYQKDKTKPEQLRRALEKLGYKAKEKTAEKES